MAKLLPAEEQLREEKSSSNRRMGVEFDKGINRSTLQASQEDEKCVSSIEVCMGH